MTAQALRLRRKLKSFGAKIYGGVTTSKNDNGEFGDAKAVVDVPDNEQTAKQLCLAIRNSPDIKIDIETPGLLHVSSAHKTSRVEAVMIMRAIADHMENDPRKRREIARNLRRLASQVIGEA